MLFAVHLSAQSYAVIGRDSFTNTTTKYVTLGDNYFQNGKIYIGGRVTKKTGTPAGTIYLETSTVGDTLWAPVATHADTLKDLVSQGFYFATVTTGHKYRLRIVPKGTQLTYIRPWIIFRKD